MAVNLIVGNDGSNNLQGGSGDDLIYGFIRTVPMSFCLDCSGARGERIEPTGVRHRGSRRR